MQLAAPPLLGLPVDEHLAGGEQLLGVPAVLGDPAQLEQLAEADDLAPDLDVFRDQARPPYARAKRLIATSARTPCRCSRKIR